MRVAALIAEYAESEGWHEGDACLEIDEEMNRSSIRYGVDIEGQPFSIEIEGDEAGSLLTITLAPPFNVLPGKLVDAALLCNFLNDCGEHNGRVTVDDEGELLYIDTLYLEGIVPGKNLLKKRVDGGLSFFTTCITSLAAVALTRKTYETVMSIYE